MCARVMLRNNLHFNSIITQYTHHANVQLHYGVSACWQRSCLVVKCMFYIKGVFSLMGWSNCICWVSISWAKSLF